MLLGCPGGPAWGFLPFPRGTSPHPPGVPDIHPLSGELCVYHIHYLRAGLLKGDGASVLIPGLGLAPPLGRHFCISSRLQKAPQMGALMFPRARVLTEVVVRWQPHLLGFLKLNLTFFLLHSTSDVHKLLGALWAWLRGLSVSWVGGGWGGVAAWARVPQTPSPFVLSLPGAGLRGLLTTRGRVTWLHALGGPLQRFQFKEQSLVCGN